MIVGAGGLGVNLIKAAKIVGAHPVISVDIHEHKRESTRALGADLYINVATQDISETLFKELGIKDVDVIIETSGAKQSLEITIQLLSGGGRYILVGQPKPGETIELKNALHLFGGEGKMIKATQGGKFSPTKEIPHYIKLHASGVLTINDLVTHRVNLSEINEAIDLVRKGMAGRILIDISS